ncbi:MAG: hypothetical protein U1F63_15855 [Chitinivorax sp.]
MDLVRYRRQAQQLRWLGVAGNALRRQTKLPAVMAGKGWLNFLVKLENNNILAWCLHWLSVWNCCIAFQRINNRG